MNVKRKRMKILDAAIELIGEYPHFGWKGYEVPFGWYDPIATPSCWKEMDKEERKAYKAGMKENRDYNLNRIRQVVKWYNDKRNTNDDGTPKMGLKELLHWGENNIWKQPTYIEQMRWLEKPSTAPKSHPFEED